MVWYPIRKKKRKDKNICLTKSIGERKKPGDRRLLDKFRWAQKDVKTLYKL